MSATLAPNRVDKAVAPRDTRTLRRIAVAVLLPLGPLAVTAIRGYLPYFHATDSTGMSNCGPATRNAGAPTSAIVSSRSWSALSINAWWN